MRCKGCDAIFHAKIIHKKNEKGEFTDEFDRFEELCSTCFSFIYREETYEELFSEQWVKPVGAHHYLE
jgi:hypothetical protein